MKKKIVVLGSTGSIGSTTIQIIKNNLKDFNVIAISTNKNIRKILKQAKLVRVKNIIINDKKSYLICRKKFNKKKINVYISLKLILSFKYKLTNSSFAVIKIVSNNVFLFLIYFKKFIEVNFFYLEVKN